MTTCAHSFVHSQVHRGEREIHTRTHACIDNLPRPKWTGKETTHTHTEPPPKQSHVCITRHTSIHVDTQKRLLACKGFHHGDVPYGGPGEYPCTRVGWVRTEGDILRERENFVISQERCTHLQHTGDAFVRRAAQAQCTHRSMLGAGHCRNGPPGDANTLTHPYICTFR